MQALINAGGKGTRMGECGIEKPMQIIGSKPAIAHVVESFQNQKSVSRILVSVSPHTPKTEQYLKEIGVETLLTSGEDFMMDLRRSFGFLEGNYVIVCPSDMPLITSTVIDKCVSEFLPMMQSMVVMIRQDLVKEMGITPSFETEVENKPYVLSGLSVMDRIATIEGKYLREHRLLTEFKELAVNINTREELERARQMFKS